MKRRVLSLMCVLTLASSLFAGCGKDASSKNEVKQIYEAALPTGEEQAEIFVEKIDGLSEDFIK